MVFSTDTKVTPSLGYGKLYLISLAQAGVSVITILISAYLVSELKFRGWETGFISIILGIASFFELIRVFFGYLADRDQKNKVYIIFGIVISFIGIWSMTYTITLTLYYFILSLIFISMGTAIVSSLIDNHLTSVTEFNNRGTVSGFIQFSRIFGFAFGAILGSVFYSEIATFADFRPFVLKMMFVSLLFFILSLLSINDNDRLEEYNSNTKLRFSEVLDLITKKFSESKGFRYAIFLLIVMPFSLFSQDYILEPFAIEYLNYGRTDIGTITIIANSVTLFTIPLGIIVDKKIGRYKTFNIGIGLVLIGLIGYLVSTAIIFHQIFIISLMTFSFGTGLLSVPAFSYILDIASLHTEIMASILAIYGLITTIGRSLNSISVGYIFTLMDKFQFSNSFSLFNSYGVIFLLEFIFSLFFVHIVKVLNQTTKID